LFLILLTGIDETFSQVVHSRSSYKTNEVLWNVKFADIFNRHVDDNQLTFDYMKNQNLTSNLNENLQYYLT